MRIPHTQLGGTKPLRGHYDETNPRAIEATCMYILKGLLKITAGWALRLGGGWWWKQTTSTKSTTKTAAIITATTAMMSLN